jgi:hypothetical protein
MAVNEIGGSNGSKGKEFEKFDERVKRIDAKLKESDELHKKRVALLTETALKLTKLLQEEKSETEETFKEQFKRVTKSEVRINELFGTIEKVVYRSKTEKT